MRFLFLIAVISVTGSVVHGQRTVSDLHWMAGCWQLKKGASVTDEQWMKPGGGLLIGMSRTVEGTKNNWFEHMRIAESDGNLTFFARTAAANEDTPFLLRSIERGKWTFENLGHDFPQRVIYKNTGRKTLLARIEGKVKEKEHGVDFHFTRIKCE